MLCHCEQHRYGAVALPSKPSMVNCTLVACRPSWRADLECSPSVCCTNSRLSLSLLSFGQCNVRSVNSSRIWLLLQRSSKSLSLLAVVCYFFFFLNSFSTAGKFSAMLAFTVITYITSVVCCCCFIILLVYHNIHTHTSSSISPNSIITMQFQSVVLLYCGVVITIVITPLLLLLLL